MTDLPSAIVNGVPLIFTTLGLDEILPVVPEEGSEEWANVWPTRQIAMYRLPLMSDGFWWEVTRTQANEAGAYTITVTSPETRYAKGFQIDAEHLDTPLWWVGFPPPNQNPTGDDGEGSGSGSPSGPGGTIQPGQGFAIR